MKLTDQQARFVLEYLKDFNGKRSATAAGYSAKTAEAQASRLLRHVKVAAAIAKQQQTVFTKLGASVEDVIHANRCIVDADVAGLFDANGKLLHPKDMPRDLRRAISRIKTRIENVSAGDGHQDTVTEVWLELKGAAIERDYKRHQLMVEKLEVDVTTHESRRQRLEQGRQRNAKLLNP